LASGNTGAIGAARAALTAAGATVDPNQMAVSSPYAPDTGFVPTTAQLASHGFSQSAADVAFGNLTAQIRTKIQQITTLLNSPSANVAANMATLGQYVTDLTTLANNLQLAANTPGIYGVVSNANAANDLLAKDMPRVLLAIVSRINAELQAGGFTSVNGGPRTLYQRVEAGTAQELAAQVSPGAMYAANRPAQFLLTGLLGYAGPIGSLIQKIYGPFLDQIQKMYLLLAAQQLLNANLPPGAAVEGLITGASQSFHVYHQPDSEIEVTGNFTLAEAQAADVYLIGGAAVNTVTGLITTLGDVRNIHSWRDLYNFYKAVIDKVESIPDAIALAHQQPDSFIQTGFNDGGCLSSLADSCIEMHYSSGFNYVGSGGPINIEPVIILVRINDPTQPGYGSNIFNFVGR